MQQIKEKMALSIKATLDNNPKNQPETPTKVITKFFERLKSSDKKSVVEDIEKEKEKF